MDVDPEQNDGCLEVLSRLFFGMIAVTTLLILLLA
jgi:hypothetical protein